MDDEPTQRLDEDGATEGPNEPEDSGGQGQNSNGSGGASRQRLSRASNSSSPKISHQASSVGSGKANSLVDEEFSGEDFFFYRRDYDGTSDLFSENTEQEKSPSVLILESDLRDEKKARDDQLFYMETDYNDDIIDTADYASEQNVRSTNEKRYIMTDIFLDTWCIRNGDGTKDLVLTGAKLNERIKRRADDRDVATIFCFLQKRPKVVGVDLSYNKLTEKSFCNTIVGFLEKNETLKYLNLANNDISGRNMNWKPEVSKHFSLEELRLNGNPLGTQGGKYIALMLSHNTSLLHLDIGQTDLNMSSLASITNRLCLRYTPATYHNYGNQPRNASSPNSRAERECPRRMDTTAEVEDITKAVKNIPRWVCANSVTKYYLWHLPPDVDIEPHEDINRTLVVLNLDRILPHYHYTLLSDHLSRLVSDMLQHNKCLVELHLEKNSLMDSDIEMLSQGLARNKTLKLINLASNRITSGGVDFLGKAIRQKTCVLEALIINHNQISNTGATSLSMAIPFSKLRFIDLAYNKIGDLGMIDLLKVARNKLLIFYIWGNPISTETTGQITTEMGEMCEKQACIMVLIRDYIYTGAILSKGMDLEIEQERSRVQAAFVAADKYKSRYYGGIRPIRRPSSPPPPLYLPHPINFLHRDVLYGRTMQTKIKPRGLDNSNIFGACAL